MNTKPVHTFLINGSEGLLSVVPMILGFHPADSVVLACMQGPKNQLRPVMRVELSDYFEDPQGMAEQLAEAALKHSESCALMFYGIAVDPYNLEDKLRECGLPVLSTVFAPNDPHELLLELQAEEVGKGKVVEPNRAALQARVEFDADSTEQADAAVLQAMGNIALRDRFMITNMTRAEQVLPALLRTCRRVPDPAPGAATTEILMVADLCATAGLFAYRLGDGALAHTCLDRALRINGNHRMTHLVLTMIASSLDPEQLDDIVAVL
jgi:hypothetical protein